MTRIREEELACIIIIVHKDTSMQFLQVGQLYRASVLLGLALCLPSSSVSSVFMVLHRCYFFCLHPSLYLLMSWAWWDWPLTWLTNHRPSVLWHCWLGHLTCKTMTYNVSSGTLNPTIQYQTEFSITHLPILRLHLSEAALVAQLHLTVTTCY